MPLLKFLSSGTKEIRKLTMKHVRCEDGTSLGSMADELVAHPIVSLNFVEFLDKRTRLNRQEWKPLLTKGDMEELFICGCGIGNNDLQVLLLAVSDLKKLRTLVLSSERITETGAEILKAVIGSLPALQRFECGNILQTGSTRGVAPGAEHIVNGLLKYDRLCTLDLSDNSFWPKMLTRGLMEVFYQCKNLRDVNISYCGLECTDYKLLLSALSCASLSRLDLSGMFEDLPSELDEEEMEERGLVVAVLAHNIQTYWAGSLKALIVADCSLEDIDLDHLHLGSIRTRRFYLDLQRNNLFEPFALLDPSFVQTLGRVVLVDNPLSAAFLQGVKEWHCFRVAYEGESEDGDEIDAENEDGNETEDED